MGLYVLVLLGGTPLGGPVLGWMAEVWGGRAPLVVGGVLTVATVVVAAGPLVLQARRARPRCRPGLSTGPRSTGQACTGMLSLMCAT